MKQLQVNPRSAVQVVEVEMLKRPQLNLPLRHFFAPGVYAREVFIPAGTLVTSKIHKYADLNIMSQGVMDVLIGDQITRVQAPFTIVTPPGTKRIAYAWTDCVWTTVFGTDITDPDEAEDYFSCSSEEEYLIFQEGQCLLSHQPSV